MPDREHMALAGTCALLVVVPLAAALLVLIKGEIADQGLDALFLLTVCGVFAAAFALVAVSAFRKISSKQLPASTGSETKEKAKPGA
ncbi:MAG TPA: hypothetical protein VF784_11305 [Anaerolineales bacterium]